MFVAGEISMIRRLVATMWITALAGAGGCSTLDSAYDWTRAYFGTAQQEAARQPVAETESTLVAAGFKQMAAKSPDELNHIRSFPPQKLTYYIENGRFVYRFADPDFCRCVYEGDEAAYQRYERLTMANDSEQSNKHFAVIRREAGQQEALDAVNDLNPFRYNWF